MKKQNINVGDKLLCKKNLFNSESTYLIEFEYYYVCEITPTNNNYTDYIYMLICEQYQPVNFRYYGEFCEYFYTKQEERKIKLEKLYEESKS